MTSSTLNSKISCIVITSDSIRWTSVIAVTRRGAILESLEVHDHVERRGHLLPDRADGQVIARHEHHGLDAGERVARRVRVDGAERAVVARVHCLEHVESLCATDLADDDPVGAHAQGVANQLADCDLALALDVLGPRLEPEHVPLVQAKLGGVLDRDDAVRVRNRRRESVQEGRLSGARTARDEDVQLGEHAALQELDSLRRQRAEADHVAEVEPLLAELTNRQDGTAQGERRDDRVDAASVRKARVDHRRGLVDTTPHLRDDLVDDAAKVRLVRKANGRLVEPALTLDPDVEGAVDHHFRDAVIGKKPLERPVPEDVVRDLGSKALAVVVGNALLLGEMAPDVSGNPVPQAVGVHVGVEQLGPELTDDGEMDPVLELGERVATGRRDDGTGSRESLVELH